MSRRPGRSHVPASGRRTGACGGASEGPPVEPGRGPERGSVALAVTVVGVLAFVAVLVAAVGGAVADQRRVESAADLAALAAAGALQAGDDPCTAARGTARRNGATVVSCRVTGGDEVVLRAERRTRPVLGRSLALTARARAGPVPSR